MNIPRHDRYEKPQEKEKLFQFSYFVKNTTRPNVDCKVLDELTRIFGEIGDDANINADFYCLNGKKVSAADHLVIDSGCAIYDMEQVIIGDNCYMAPNVKIYSGYNEKSNNRDEKRKNGPVLLGNNVWLGSNSVILPNVELGDNVVVCSNSVITHSYGDNSIIAGNPSKEIYKGEPPISQIDDIFKRYQG